MRRPKEVVGAWVEAFNRADVDGLAGLYADAATNHQVMLEPVVGRAAIREMFRREFAAASMVCIPENVFEDGEWAILEWRDPNGLRGCGLFHVVGGLIHFQRGYWDRLTFLRHHGLPAPPTSCRRQHHTPPPRRLIHAFFGCLAYHYACRFPTGFDKLLRFP